MKKNLFNAILLFSILVLLFCCSAPPKDSFYKNGDLIFMRLNIPHVKPLKHLARTDLTHTGVIFIKEDSVFVYEAGGTVELIPLYEWIDRRTVDSMIFIKRIKPEYRKEDFDKSLLNAGFKFKGRLNDIVFSWSDSLMYSSELVWKIFDRGPGIQLCDLKNINSWDAKNRFVLDRLKQKYNMENALDSTTQVVSPDDIFNSPKLEEVFSGKRTSLPKM